MSESNDGATGKAALIAFSDLVSELGISAAAFGEGLNLQTLREDSPLKPFMCKACNSFGAHINTVNCCPNCGAELSDNQSKEDEDEQG